MEDFLCEVQCDEQYIPTEADWAEYTQWLDNQEESWEIEFSYDDSAEE